MIENVKCGPGFISNITLHLPSFISDICMSVYQAFACLVVIAIVCCSPVTSKPKPSWDWFTIPNSVHVVHVEAETEREREMFYLTTHSTHFIYGYMASDIWLRTILIVRKETRCRHIGYSFRLTARVLLYAPSHRQDNTYHGLCYTSRGALAGTRNSSMGPSHEGSIRRPTAPWANALPLSYVPLPVEACLFGIILTSSD